ncbi:MAG: AAA family ATPase [Pseudomonadota bacterium]
MRRGVGHVSEPLRSRSPPFDPTPRADDLFETLRPTTRRWPRWSTASSRTRASSCCSARSGVGKTTVLRRALQYVASAEPKLLVVELANPTVGPAALAARIHRALQLHFDAGFEADLDSAARRAGAAGR